MMKRLTELSPALLSVVNDQAGALQGIYHRYWIVLSFIKKYSLSAQPASALADLSLLVFGYKAKLNSQALS